MNRIFFNTFFFMLEVYSIYSVSKNTSNVFSKNSKLNL